MAGPSPINQQDMDAKSRGYVLEPPKVITEWFLQYTDARDLPIVFAFFNITTLYLPIVLLLFLWGSSQPALVAPIFFFVNLIFFQERYFLALHYSQHRPVFKGALAILNEWPHAVLSVLYGLPPLTYHLHHCVMHHREDNRAFRDLSATEHYRRDNWLHWAQYWLRHAFLILFELPWYAIRTKQYLKGVVTFAIGISYWGLMFFLFRVRPWPTFWLLFMPNAMGSALLMFGNWGQHVFVDPADPRNDYKLTYNCINSRVNRDAFNDGYHIVHHLFPGCHWTELPHNFHKNRQLYVDNDAFIFEGLDFFEVGFFVLTKQWKKLAQHLVHPITGERWPEERALKELQRRVLPIDPSSIKQD